MKKFFSFLLTALLMAACSQKTTTQTAVTDPDALDAIGIEALNTIDVEKLIEPFDLSMDISQLSVSDLYILRHAFAARKGYPFRDAYLRYIYLGTSWYDSLMWVFDDTEANFKQENHGNVSWRDEYYLDIKDDVLQLEPDEQAFVDRVKAREAELLKLNFETPEGYRVTVGNMLNARQMDSMPAQLARQLGRYGFAIVPTKHDQLFHVYERNDYHAFPSFVTTDVFLQLYHLYFDCLLREVEEKSLFPLLFNFCQETRRAVNQKTYADNTYDTQAATRWLDTYLSVAIALLQAKEPTGNDVALHEYRQAMKSENSLSDFLGYKDAMFEYSLFRPRGHYTRNDTLKRYFRAMMWLQTVPFQADSPFDMLKAAVLASVVGNDKKVNDLYLALTEPMDWLMGKGDDVSILQVSQLLAKNETCDIDPNGLSRKVNELAEKQTRIRPKFLRTSRNKVRLMPQRYQPDAEVLQEMVDYKGNPSARPVPQGLDVMAAMGVGAAEQILMQQQQNWKQLRPTLKRMKSRMDSIDWQATITNQWLQVLKSVNEQPQHAPYFMLTPQWQRKSLNAALASWAELKHDAILYAKQPLGAECGGAGPPHPVLKGYVEPNDGFWKKAVELLSNTGKALTRLGGRSERAQTLTTQMGELATLLLNISEKELRGEALSDEENDQLKHIGATFENISLDLLRQEDQQLYEWTDVQGPERSVALIADVYTANADNNPNKCVLFAGTGQADEIYVLVEMQGYLYLTRGAVLSYRELTRPLNQQRMNDEEWQKMLEDKPRLGVPAWMQPITVPLQQQPTDNEEVFYSSGC